MIFYGFIYWRDNFKISEIGQEIGYIIHDCSQFYCNGYITKMYDLSHLFYNKRQPD